MPGIPSKYSKVGERLRILAFDPGKTTGYAFFIGPEYKKSGAINTYPLELSTTVICNILNAAKPDILIIEEYRIYPHKVRTHINDDLFTSQLIGQIRTHAIEKKIPYKMQGAWEGKKIKDAHLKQFSIYDYNKHARDAIRHCCYYIAKGH